MFKQDKKIYKILELLFLTLMSFVYIILEYDANLYTMIPLVAFFIGIFLPICVITVTCRNTPKYILIDLIFVFMGIVLTGVVAFKANIFDLLLSFLSVTLLPVSIGLCFKKSYTYLKTLIIGTFFNTMYLIVNLLKIIFVDRVNITDDIIKPLLSTQFSEIKAVLPDMAITLNDIVNYITLNAPCAFIIISMFIALFYIALSKKFINTIYKGETLNIGHFSEIHLNKSVSLAFFIFVILSLFSSKASVFTDALSNVIAIMLAMFFIDGLSFIDFYFRKTGLWTIVRVIIYILVITVLSLLFVFSPVLIVTLIGISDCTGNYRKINDNNTNS